VASSSSAADTLFILLASDLKKCHYFGGGKTLFATCLSMAFAGCGGESTKKKTYLLYIVEKKRTKATTWLLQNVEERVQRQRHIILSLRRRMNKGDDMAIAGPLFSLWRRRENKGDDMSLAGCGGESSEKKHLPLFSSWRRRAQRRRHGSCRLWRREYRDEDIPYFLCEEENKGDDMALAGCGRESTEKKTYLLYVVKKKITKTTTWLL
jgi:hypothetical protein